MRRPTGDCMRAYRGLQEGQQGITRRPTGDCRRAYRGLQENPRGIERRSSKRYSGRSTNQPRHEQTGVAKQCHREAVTSPLHLDSQYVVIVSNILINLPATNIPTHQQAQKHTQSKMVL
eukprot:1150585-Pelagomonas_calceolata.AAC.1